MKKNKKKDYLTRSTTVRFTQKEYETLKRRQKEENYRTLSAFMHRCVMRRSEGSGVRFLRCDTDLMEMFLMEIKRIGVNVNQVTRKLNTFDSSGEGVLAYETRKLQQKMDEVREQTEGMSAMIRDRLLPFCEDRSETEEDESRNK